MTTRRSFIQAAMTLFLGRIPGALLIRKSMAESKPIFHFTRAIRRRQTAGAYCSRGMTYLRIGDFERAIADFTWALQLDSKHALAYLGRGVAYREVGRFTRAIADFTTHIWIRPTSTG